MSDTTIDQITIDADGVISVRLRKSDGEFHRTTLPPGIDVTQQMELVSAHLASMGVAPITKNADWMKTISDSFWTATVKKDYADKQKAIFDDINKKVTGGAKTPK